MQLTPAKTASAKDSQRPPQVDIVAAVDALVAKLQNDPENQDTLDELLVSTQLWLASDGCETPPKDESTSRTRLAAWLAHLSPGGTILHFGWREGAVASALAATGASVTSFLDHPGRAMAAAVGHGSERVHFLTLDQVQECGIKSANLVVVETAGMTPTIEFDHVRNVLRAGGWLAVLGMPVAPNIDGLIDAGRFCLDGAEVRPCSRAVGTTQLTLYRLAAPASSQAAKPVSNPPARTKTQPSGPSALNEIITRRGKPLAQELAIQHRAARVVQIPLPDQTLIDWVGGGTPQTFHNIGLVNFHQLALYCHLEPGHHVLEPGCGCGRNARPMAAFLDPQQGSYTGFDIHTGAIEWATKQITEPYPHVKFDFADIRNTNYNPEGAHTACEFIFPYGTESFDVVFMPSVFTHMTQDELRHYASEIHRVLKPGGLLMSWHFLLDETSRKGIAAGEASIEFKDYDDVSMAMLPDNPCAAIAFDERWVLECYESLGLRAQAVIHGRWSGRDGDGFFHDYQDRILARKVD